MLAWDGITHPSEVHESNQREQRHPERNPSRSVKSDPLTVDSVDEFRSVVKTTGSEYLEKVTLPMYLPGIVHTVRGRN